VTDELKDVSAKVNTPTSLRCDGEGYTHCVWCKSSTGEKKTMKYFTETEVPVLHFPDFSPDDGGYYTCDLKNRVTQFHVTTRIAHLEPYIKGNILETFWKWLVITNFLGIISREYNYIFISIDIDM